MRPERLIECSGIRTPQVGPMHSPAPMHRDFEVVEPRADCALLADKFCEDLGESPACEAVRSGTPKLAPSACVEIRAHYADVLADLRKMNQRFEPLSLAVADAIVAPGAPGLGDPSAPIELVVFWDYEDPYCAKAIAALAEVYRRFPGQIRVVVSQYPLAFHPHAALAAEAALSAHTQGGFWRFSEAVFASQSALELSDVLQYASQVKLDAGKIAHALDTHEYAAALEREIALGDQAHLAGVPILYVNRQPCANPTTIDGVLACVESARRSASTRQ